MKYLIDHSYRPLLFQAKLNRKKMISVIYIHSLLIIRTVESRSFHVDVVFGCSSNHTNIVL